MKRSVLLVILVSVYSFAYSQINVISEKKITKNIIGIYSNIGICQPVRFHHIISDVSSHGKESFSIGLKYLKPLTEMYRFEVDFRYSKYYIENKLLDYPIPGKISESFKIITIPVIFQKYYPKNYFISLGSIFDFGLSRNGSYIITDTQSGIGLSLGAGKEILIQKFSIDIAPNIEIHSLLPFHAQKDQQRLIFLALNIGFNYHF
jgi:hypothetical protein